MKPMGKENTMLDMSQRRDQGQLLLQYCHMSWDMTI